MNTIVVCRITSTDEIPNKYICIYYKFNAECKDSELFKNWNSLAHSLRLIE